jgi:hypothetical protein
VLVIVLGVTVVWHAPLRRERPDQPDVAEWIVLPPVSGTTTTRPQQPPRARRVAGLVAAAPAPSRPVDVPLRVPTALRPDRAEGPIVLGPQLGDGRVWVGPRPALPADVAERLYGDTTGRDEIAMQRLQVMLDSLNRVIDREQRAYRKPTWSTEVGGIPFSLDSQYINIAGVKIPTMALALLGDLFPQGNYDAALRERQFQAMREDLMRAATRAETFRDFQHYVKELRARKQAERDAERRRKDPPDTTHIIP